MIEFTLSRVTMAVCGIILVSAVMLPLTGGYETAQDEDLTGLTDGLARMLDTFWDSRADTVTVNGWEILPDPGCSLTVDGHRLILQRDGREYVSLTAHACRAAVIPYNGSVEVSRDGGMLSFAPQ